MTLWYPRSFVFLLASLVAHAVSSPSTVNNIVDLGYARYRGNVTFPNTVAFLGLPYAEPPLADRRFRAPVPLNTARIQAEARGGILDATSAPEFCVQGTTGAGDAGGAGSEDCLKINVYAPAGAREGDKLPVMVYIHGGGYIFGNPLNFPFDHWINQVPDVVIASVYYRIDSFGFLTHPDFANPSTNLGDFNVGFQDQTEALRWVQKHISAFGGDPGRVTINGHSAGAASVELHLTAPNNIGLFHAGIAQSVYRAPVPAPLSKLSTFNTFAQNAGCGSGSVSAKMTCLRKASVSALAQAQDITTGSSIHTFIPVQDPKTIPFMPSLAILQGKFNAVPLIVGATSNETLGGSTNISETLLAFWPLLSSTDLQQYSTEYPLSDFDSASQQFRVAIGETALRCAREIMGGGFGKKANAFTYRFNQPDPTSGSNLVEHAAENFMLFQGIETG
ncbi:hypothetical protein NLI96_g6702 [Meripilus lineatus]|uniref:Carboxylic ester hydrolase n=1 Tax=Meripilus lineatus TaxID=2056292 RepID=A0AAD5YHW9_9APHY|nr:hypothetical protein NLI96_g6702 [Physisporinus lineatus]